MPGEHRDRRTSERQPQVLWHRAEERLPGAQRAQTVLGEHRPFAARRSSASRTATAVSIGMDSEPSSGFKSLCRLAARARMAYLRWGWQDEQCSKRDLTSAQTDGGAAGVADPLGVRQMV